MDDDRLLIFSLLIFEGEIETIGLIEVTLYRRELPLSSYSITEHEVELRSIESRFSWHRSVIEIIRDSGFFESLLCYLPDIIASEVFLWSEWIANRERYPVSVHKTESRIELLHDIDDSRDFCLDLTHTTEKVSIILSDRSHTRET